MGIATLAEKIIALILPPIGGALVYFGSEPKTTDVLVCAVIWTFLWWFVFAVAGALDEFY